MFKFINFFFRTLLGVSKLASGGDRRRLVWFLTPARTVRGVLGLPIQVLLLLTDDNGAYEQNCWPVEVVKLDLDFS